MKGKKDVILIVVTVIMIIVLVVGYIYDRNTAVLKRTLDYAVTEDENLEFVKMNKVGFLYMRAAYEAKFKIKDSNADNYIIDIASHYGGLGQMFDYTQFKEYEADALSAVSIKPNPKEDSFTWVIGVPLRENTDEKAVYIISIEADNNAFLYVYYSRK